MYMNQDLQVTESKQTLLLLYLHIRVAMTPFEHPIIIIIITILMAGEEGKT